MDCSLAKSPFVIGITGHRDATYGHDFDLKIHLKSLILDWFDFINKGLKSTASQEVPAYTPIRIMTGMALGPDLTIIEAAIEARSLLTNDGYHPSCIQIHGILPLPLSTSSELLKMDYEQGVAWSELEKVVTQLAESPWDHIDELEPVSNKSSQNFAKSWEKSAQNLSEYKQARNLQYLVTGLLISNCSHLLISCWDGKVPKNSKDALGGTSDITLSKLGYIPRLLENQNTLDACQELIPSPLSGFEPGLVCHIDTHRAQQRENFKPLPEEVELFSLNKGEVDYTMTVVDRDPEGILPLYHEKHGVYLTLAQGASRGSTIKCEEKISALCVEWKTLLSSLRSINRDITLSLSSDKDKKQGVTEQYQKLRRYNPYCLTENHVSSSEISGEDSLYSSWLFFGADKAAGYFQSKFRRSLLVPYFLISALGLSCWEFYNISNNSVFLLAAFGLLALLLMLFQRSKVKQYKSRYQSLRALAEILRVKGYLNQSGVQASDELLPRSQRKDFPVHYYAIRSANIAAWSVPFTGTVSKQEVSDSTETNIARSSAIAWLQSQIKFFESRCENNAFSAENGKTDFSKMVSKSVYERPFWLGQTIEKVSDFLLRVAFIFGFMLLVTEFLTSATPEWLQNTIKAIIPISLLLSAVVNIWSSRNSLAHVAENYDDMLGLMMRAKEALESGAHKPYLEQHEKQMLIELGRSALLEHLIWTETQRKSDIK